MRETALSAWIYLENTVKMIAEKDSALVFNPSKFDIFYDRFKYWRELILSNFMKSNVEELDRHKIASILTISAIESKCITYNSELTNEKIFLGLHLIAVSCGLSYMQQQLNMLLKEENIEPIQKYIMPTPFSCSTNYLNVIARNLYYEENATDSNGKKLWNLNPLQLSNTYYLLELYSLEHYKIPTDILAENKADE